MNDLCMRVKELEEKLQTQVAPFVSLSGDNLEQKLDTTLTKQMAESLQTAGGCTEAERIYGQFESEVEIQNEFAVGKSICSISQESAKLETQRDMQSDSVEHNIKVESQESDPTLISQRSHQQAKPPTQQVVSPVVSKRDIHSSSKKSRAQFESDLETRPGDTTFSKMYRMLTHEAKSCHDSVEPEHTEHGSELGQE